jgi:hypothetical protein
MSPEPSKKPAPVKGRAVIFKIAYTVKFVFEPRGLREMNCEALILMFSIPKYVLYL